MLVKKPTKFMTNAPYIGEELSLRCDGSHRHLVLIGGKAKRAEIYPDKLCKAMLTGLVKQMESDGRRGCTYRVDEDVTMRDAEEKDVKMKAMDGDDPMEINQICWEHMNENPKHILEWTRRDYGTTRLMLPGKAGPTWSSCIRSVTIDTDSGRTIEDRSVDQIKGRERRREFKGGARNIVTTFTYRVDHDVQPHYWECRSCQHEGWLKTPGTCQACGSIGMVRPIT